MKELEVFGLAIFVDDTKILRTTFLTILAAGSHDEAGLIGIANCVEHVAKGFKKDAEHIDKFFVPHIERIDPEKRRCVI